MTLYTHEDRQRSRSAVTQLNLLQGEAKKSVERGLILPAHYKEPIVRVTGTEDQTRWVDALGAISNKVQGDHLSRLLPLAKDDFNAFCEYVNPDEAPTSKWHVYLTDLLQEIELNPDRERFVLNCPPGHAKPLDIDTPVLMADGSWKTLGDIVVGDFVTTERRERRKVTAVHDQGVLDTLVITTARGRKIVAAPDHSFRVEDRWVQAGALRPGDRLSIVGAPTLAYDASERSVDFFELAAYLQANGGRSYFTRTHKAGPKTYRNVYLWSAKQQVAQAMTDCLKRCGVDFKGRLAKYEKVWKVRLSTAWGDALAQDFGIDAKINERRVPAFVQRGDADKVQRYLQTLVNAMGEAADRFTIPRVVLYFKSIDFARDVQRLFAALDVPCVVEPRAKGRTRLYLSGGDLEAFFAAGFLYGGAGADNLDKKRAAHPSTPTLVEHDTVAWIDRAGERPCKCLTVDGDPTFLADGVVVHNSTYASRLFVAWRLGRWPSQKIIGGGHSQRFVENEFSGKIRNLVRSPEFGNVFPGVVVDHATSAKDMWAIAGHGGQYAAKGAGQAIHGLRAHFVCVDDPYRSIEQAESAGEREKIRTWFFGDVGSRLLPFAKVFLIMTRFHEDDLTGSIIEMNHNLPDYAKYHIVEAPALCYDPETDVLGRDLGEVLWDYYDLSYFAAKKIEWSYQRFALVYQQLADAASDSSVASKFQTYSHLPHLEPKVLRARFDAGHFDERGRPIPDRKEHFRRVVVSVDAAQKKGVRNDYSVVQVWGETHDRKHYLIHQERKKVEILGLTEMIERIARRYDVDAILVEDKGNGTAYIQARGQTDSQRRLAPAPIEAIQVPSTYSKEFRFNEVVPMIEAGEVYLPEKAPWIDLFIREVGQFPDSARDDQVDSMTQYLRWAKAKRSRFGARKVGSMG